MGKVKKNRLSGEEAMLLHFRHRQELELTICEEVFPDRYTVLKSKKYTDESSFVKMIVLRYNR